MLKQFDIGADNTRTRSEGNIMHLPLIHDASYTARTTQPGSLLTIAAVEGRVKILRILLYWEAGPSLEESDLNTALVEASRAGHDAVVKLLLDAGADVNHTGSDDGSALLAASQNGHMVW